MEAWDALRDPKPQNNEVFYHHAKQRFYSLKTDSRRTNSQETTHSLNIGIGAPLSNAHLALTRAEGQAGGDPPVGGQVAVHWQLSGPLGIHQAPNLRHAEGHKLQEGDGIVAPTLWFQTARGPLGWAKKTAWVHMLVESFQLWGLGQASYGQGAPPSQGHIGH